MHPRPPKSAPPRLRSRHASADKEIEDWAFSDNEFSRETIRHAGQLTENVTEERLLKARLMELGKERFKILSKHISEKQSFLEKQRRKAAIMRKQRISSGSDRTRTRASSSYSTFHSILAKGDTNITQYSTMIRPKTVQFEPTDKSGYISTGLDDYRSSTFSGGSEPGKKSGQNDASTPMGMYTQWSRPSTAGTVTFSRPISSVTSRSNHSKSWVGAKRQTIWGGKCPGVTGDPRYVNLEKALSENYIPRTKYNIKAIIERLETIKQPKQVSVMEDKRRLEVKIKEFMQERGIDFGIH